VKERNYDRTYPVVVTALDSEYHGIAQSWTRRMTRIGLSQQVVVALDKDTGHSLATLDLPHLTLDAYEPLTASLLQTSSERSSLRWQVPSFLVLAKFLVPVLLLQANFHAIIFSEADVYMVANPIGVIAAADRDQWKDYEITQWNANATIVAMFENNSTASVNIGFMIWHGKDGIALHHDMILAAFKSLYAKADFQTGTDQSDFNTLLGIADGVSVGRLPSSLFAVRPRDVCAQTIVAHFAYANPGCKRYLLDKLYNSTEESVTSKLLFSVVNATIKGHLDFGYTSWSDC
jgi:hypothetical protein